MKIKLLFLLFSLPCLAFAQDEELWPLRLQSLWKASPFPLDTAGIWKLPYYEDDCGRKGDSPRWHVDDLDFDGRKDLIFSGPCLPYEATIFLLQRDTGYLIVGASGGSVIHIEKRSEKTFVHVLAEPCCCIYNFYFSEYVFDAKGLVSKAGFSFYPETRIFFDGKYEKKTISGILRRSPVIDDKPYPDPCTDDIFIGNQIKTLTKREVLVLYRDKSWQLVFLEREEEESGLIGWILGNK